MAAYEPPIPGIRTVEPLGRADRTAGAPTCALTVDVEDWYQSCIDFDAPISERPLRNTERMLALLAETQTKATFFVQGLVAEKHPGLVRDLVAEGHEVQSHAHTHRPLDRMTPAAVAGEIDRSVAAITGATGVPVTAFRAPDFTLNEQNSWTLELLAERGFSVDSSIFPIRTRRYGVADWALGPVRIGLDSGLSIVEAPVAVWGWGRIRVPLAGGGYMRLLPGPVIGRGLRAIVASGRPAIVYCHPYEFNADELADYRGLVPERFRRLQGLGRPAFVRRLRRLLATMPFGRLDAVLSGNGTQSVARDDFGEPAAGA